MAELAPDFWQNRPLEDLNPQEWEALCDGCGRCCLVKLEDFDSDEVYFTSLACELLDTESCRCQDYSQRFKKVEDCIQLSADKVENINWLPATCAYRLRHEGEPLPEWHPLVSGNPESVREAGISVSGRVTSEAHVHPDSIEEHIVYWVD
ncbi:MAG: YcgN family cysteine cluster protein [Candidatus Reddybacter sp.]